MLSSLSNSLDKTSEPKIKRKWERGSSCLSPLSGVKRPKGLPFSKMEKEAEVMQVLTQSSQIELNPSCFFCQKPSPYPF